MAYNPNANSDVNTTYSGMEFETAGTLSGSPAAVIAGGYAGGSATSKSPVSAKVAMRYPITLDKDGNVRLNGTLAVLLTGITGTSASRVSLNWRELR